MVRQPEPKQQARLLVEALREQGVSLAHQKALDIVARLHGHRSWVVMAANKEPAVSRTSEEGISFRFAPILEAARAVVNSADDTGCSGDLTVVELSALETLEEQLDAFEEARRPVPKVVGDVTVKHVLHLRPDLSHREAADVLEFCRTHVIHSDKTLSLQTLLDASFEWHGEPPVMPALLVAPDGSKRAVTVELYSGRIYAGFPEAIELRLAEGEAPVVVEKVVDGSWVEFNKVGQAGYVYERSPYVFGGDATLLAELAKELSEECDVEFVSGLADFSRRFGLPLGRLESAPPIHPSKDTQ